jgi:hypothetical protein
MDWDNIKIKAIVRLRFLRDKNFPIQIGHVGCPSEIEGFPTENLWDVRIQITINRVAKDETIETLIVFLSSDVAEKHLKKGAKIKLWELGDLAEGEIIKLLY